MTYRDWLAERTADPVMHRLYCEEAAKINVTEAIAAAMESQGVSRAELAKRLNISRAGVTQMLRSGNLSAARVGRIARALGCPITVTFIAGPYQ